MTKEQKLKIIQVLQLTTAFILLMECIFAHPPVINYFASLIKNSNGWIAYVVIWVIMFLQTTVLNIPAYVILSASVAININTLSVLYISVVLSAYMVGCFVAYLLGLSLGKKAVKWCAGSEEDYDKWCYVLNKKGKWWYFLTVIFPLFPDDILCLVAGATKFNFLFYIISNLIGRGVGLISMLLTLNMISVTTNGFPFMLIIWGVVFIIESIIYCIIKNKKEQ